MLTLTRQQKIEIGLVTPASIIFFVVGLLGLLVFSGMTFEELSRLFNTTTSEAEHSQGAAMGFLLYSACCLLILNALYSLYGLWWMIVKSKESKGQHPRLLISFLVSGSISYVASALYLASIYYEMLTLSRSYDNIIVQTLLATIIFLPFLWVGRLRIAEIVDHFRQRKAS